MNFTIRDTNIGKGIAICLMIIHHLFNSKERLQEGISYIPLLVFKDIEINIAIFGKICVASFIFLSGYGIYLSLRKNDKKMLTYVIDKLKRFYPVFWAQFIVFVPIGYIFYSDVTIINQDTLRYVSDPKIMALSFLGLSNRYNGAWWFVTLYLELLILVLPIYYYLINKNIRIFLGLHAVLFLINYNMNINVNLLIYQTSFAFGMLCAKYDIFSKPFINKVAQLNAAGIIAIISLSVFLRFSLGAIYDFILAPVFIYSSIRLLKYCRLDAVFEYLGKYSFPMWLNHNFFALYFFQGIMFYPKYSPLVILFVIISSLISSIIIEKLRLKLMGIFTPFCGKKNNLPDSGSA